MTETVKASPDDTKKDSSQSPSSPKTKSKAVKQANDGNERPKTTEKIEKPPTKVVVRRLPPTMTLETFLDQVAPLPPVDYMYFVKADASLAPNSFARAYLHFVHVADLLIFTEKFDNYVFVDSKGNEYPAIVEYAPFQRIPKQRSTRKKDPRIGTLGNDPYYLEFIEALKAEESQRKSASKTNKQHFFETSTGSVTPKITSTPLLEFLKARRADKLKTKEDKIAERRKREIERRKARDDVRAAVKQIKTSEGESDIAFSSTPQIKPYQPSSDRTPDLAEIQTRYLRCMIGLDTDTSGLEQIAGHGTATDRAPKDSPDAKRFTKDGGVKEIMSKRRDDDRGKAREKDKDKEKKDKDSQKELKRDRRDSVKDQGPVHDKEKDKENQPATTEPKSKETRRSGKSYQEERQRLNERRLASKGITPKPATSGDGTSKPDKSESTSNDEVHSDKKPAICKDFDTTSESRSRPHDKYRSSDQNRQQSTREGKKFEKSNKTGREPEQRRSYDSRRNTEDRNHDDTKEIKKNVANDRNLPSDTKPEEHTKSQPSKEEHRKKSYNQEREQRRAAGAADRKTQSRREHTNAGSKGEMYLDSKEHTKNVPDDNNPDKERRPSLDFSNNNRKSDNSRDEPSRSKSLADIKSLQPSRDKKKDSFDSKSDEKDKKDPRAERRIRNKDRPSIEIYRPGMGRFSRQRLEREKVLNKGSSTERDSPSSSPSPVPSAAKTPVISEKDNE